MESGNNIAGFSIEEVVHHIELNFWETWSNFGRGPGCQLHDEGDALWFETPIPIVPYNTVMKFQVQENVDKRVETIVNHFRRRNVTQLWLIHASATPTLPTYLQQHGLREVEIAPGMARSLENISEPPPLPEGVEVRKVMTDEDLHHVDELAAWRWGVPDQYHAQLNEILKMFRIGQPATKTHFWLAWKDGTPISKIGMYYGSRAAGIYGVVTKPEARGLGLASILMTEAMKTAREDGYKLAVLDSSPLAEDLYKRLGFTTVTSFPLYTSEPAYL